MSVLLSLGSVLLLLVSFFLCFIVLLQRSSANAGMGTAFGAGAAEAAFGANTNKALTSATVWCTAIFFGLSLFLYLGNLHFHNSERGVKRSGNVESLVPAAPKGALGEAKPLTPGAPAVPTTPGVVVPSSVAPAVPAAPVPPVTTPTAPAAPATAPATPATGTPSQP